MIGVIHAAAETHVDRSIADAAGFVRSNIEGTRVVLEACRRSGRPLLHVSTDEVYGSAAEGAFEEESPLRPNSPYAATKAAADLLCRAYGTTYGVPVTVVRGTNAFGPRQHRENAIPTFVLAALEGRSDLDLALLPAEAVNDDLRFLDDVDARDLAGHLGVPVKFSYDFADALAGQGVTA